MICKTKGAVCPLLPLNAMPLRSKTSLNSPSPSVWVRHAMLTVWEVPLLLFVPARIVAVLPTMPKPPLPVVAMTVDSRFA